MRWSWRRHRWLDAWEMAALVARPMSGYGEFGDVETLVSLGVLTVKTWDWRGRNLYRLADGVTTEQANAVWRVFIEGRQARGPWRMLHVAESSIITARMLRNL